MSKKIIQESKSAFATCVNSILPVGIASVSFLYLSFIKITYKFPFIVRGNGLRMSIVAI